MHNLFPPGASVSLGRGPAPLDRARLREELRDVEEDRRAFLLHEKFRALQPPPAGRFCASKALCWKSRRFRNFQFSPFDTPPQRFLWRLPLPEPFTLDSSGGLGPPLKFV